MNTMQSSSHNVHTKRQWGTDRNQGNRAAAAGVYYGVTALIIVAIALTVIFGRVFQKRKQRRLAAQRTDLERQEQARRGEAAGLPTYGDHGATIAIPMPTLAYPEGAYRRMDGAQGTFGGAQQDPSLPGYESAPPKYEYGANAATPANATSTFNPNTEGGGQTAAPQMYLQPQGPPPNHRSNSNNSTAGVGGRQEMQETRSTVSVTTPLASPNHLQSGTTTTPPPFFYSRQSPSQQGQGAGAQGVTSPAGEMQEVSLSDEAAENARRTGS